MSTDTYPTTVKSGRGSHHVGPNETVADEYSTGGACAHNATHACSWSVNTWNRSVHATPRASYS